MAESSSEITQQYIADLERQLADARTAAGKDQSAPYERAEVHTAVGEQMKQQLPSYVPATPGAPMSAANQSSVVPSELVGQVQALVDIAFAQGIPAAMSEAEKAKNSALVDALHDVLADQFHALLLERQKIQPAP